MGDYFNSIEDRYAFMKHISYGNPYVNVHKTQDFTKWTCKDGTSINITDMTTSHLRNTISFLQKKMTNDTPYTTKIMYSNYIEAMQTEINKRTGT